MPHSSKGIENLVWASTDVLSAVKGTIRVNSWDAPWIVMDPRDGAILAMASLPTFDANRFRESAPQTWRNRNVQDM